MDHYVSGYWEERGYSDEAEIEPGKVRDLNSGRVRPIPAGEVVRFLDE
jgi:ribosomal protein S12 methylthiotransferase accessory factor YcaO